MMGHERAQTWCLGITSLLSVVLATALLVGCGTFPAPPVVPPIEQPPLPPPPPTPPVEPVDPTEPVGFEQIVLGMSRADIERAPPAGVGFPTSNPPENAAEGVDVVIYDREGGAFMLVYRADVLEKKVWTPTGVVR